MAGVSPKPKRFGRPSRAPSAGNSDFSSTCAVACHLAANTFARRASWPIQHDAGRRRPAAAAGLCARGPSGSTPSALAESRNTAFA